MRSRTCRQRIASQAFRHRELAREAEQPRLSDLSSSGCSQLCVPCPEHRSPVAATQAAAPAKQRRPSLQGPSLLRHWQFTITKRSSAGQQIFFLLRQQARQPQLRKVGQTGLETPYLAGVTLKAPLAARPSPCCPLPTSHIPPGLACCAQPGVLVCPAPANTARPLQGSLYLSASSPFASHFMPDICSLLSHTLALNLIDNLSIGLVFYRWCFFPNITKPKVPHSSDPFSRISFDPRTTKTASTSYHAIFDHQINQ